MRSYLLSSKINSNPLKNLKLLTSFTLVTIANFGFSQRMDLNEGSIAVNYTLSPTQAFKDTSGNLNSHSIGGSINVPLFGNRGNASKKSFKESNSGFYQTSLHTSFESSNQTIGFITNESQRTFYNGSLGINGLFFNGKQDVFLVDAAMGIASDKLNSSLRYRFSGSFIVNHIQNPTLNYQYGIVLTYAYGRPLPLPVLGIRKKLSDTWSLSAILPVSIQVSNKLTEKMRLSFSIKPEGNRFQFQNQNDFSSSESIIYMQLRQFQFGTAYNYRFSKSFSFGAEAGLLFGGKLKFTDPENPKIILYQTGVNAGSKFRVSLRYHLRNNKNTNHKMNMDGEMFNVN